MSKMSWKQAIRAGDSLVRVEDLKWAGPSDFDSNKTVILLHGFGSSGEYLLELGEYLQRNGLGALIYNYNSLRGIDDIASALEGILSQLDSVCPGQSRKTGSSWSPTAWVGWWRAGSPYASGPHNGSEEW
jgi:hypothetical protein